MGREIDVRKDERKDVDGLLERPNHGREVFGWATISRAHPFQKHCLKAPVVNKDRIRDMSQESQEVSPDRLFVVRPVCPEAALLESLRSFNRRSDQVIKIAVRQPFHIEVDGSSFELQFRGADNMSFLFTNRERLQRRMVLLLPGCAALSRAF